MEDPYPTVEIRHKSLLRGATEYAEVKYLRSLKDGVSHPAVLVLDLDDPVSRQIIGKFKSPDKIAELPARPKPDGNTWFGTILCHMPRKSVKKYLPEDHEEIADQVSRWDEVGPPNSFPVILITGGATSIAALPVPKV